ncbi:NAD(P)H-quinone oxidoreductase subunit T, chloroplastic-like [Salvia divinorum]|uniref:NAD(P)H-quinone oxidoreductase subunit T, chloroplastic-like n=1 Tax=Salvia divinorum TaxID=28513 RepID=A0ABD1HPS2_SALDI
MAAPTATPLASLSLLASNHITKSRIPRAIESKIELIRHSCHCSFQVLAVQGSSPKREEAAGGSSDQHRSRPKRKTTCSARNYQCCSSTDSYYQFLGIPVNADEGISSRHNCTSSESRQVYEIKRHKPREAEKMRIKLDDSYMREVQQYELVPDMVDRLGGRNMELSDQATSSNF